MAGQKFIPHGTTVSFAAADIGGIQSVGLPERERGVADVTDNDSGGDREFLPGLRDGGVFTLTCLKIPGDAGQAAILTNYNSAFGSNDTQAVVITLPAQANDNSNVTTLTFDAFVTNPGTGEWEQNSDDPALITFGFKVTSTVTEATA